MWDSASFVRPWVIAVAMSLVGVSPVLAQEGDEAEAGTESEAGTEPEPEPEPDAEAARDRAPVEGAVPAPPDRPPEQAMPAVVGVRSVGQTGVGVFVDDGRHVVTDYDVVQRGREVEVRLSDETSILGTTTAIDRSHGLAVVQLSRPVRSASAPPIAEQRPVLGSKVWIVQPLWVSGSGLQWSATRGEVATGEGSPVLVSTSTSPQRGAAVVTTDGRLVGIATGEQSRGLARVRSAEHVAALAEQRDGAEAYAGRVRPFFRFGWSFEFRYDDGNDELNLNGPTISFGLVIHDRWLFEIDANFLVFDFEDTGPAVRRDTRAFQGQALFGYRALLTSARSNVPVYFTPAVGAIVDWVRVEERQLVVGTDPGAGEPVPVDFVETVDDEEVFVRPVVRLGFTMFRFLELAASAQIDVQKPERTRLGLFVGFGF